MISAREAARQFVPFLLALDSEPPGRELHFRELVSDSRNSQRAFEIVCQVYCLAAMRDWKPTLPEISVLVYAPLDNPALIPQVQKDVERILHASEVNGRL